MNSVNITGRLTRDPEGSAAGAASVVRFTVAVDGYNPSKKEKETDFIPCVVFGKQADFLSSYGTKGREISVTGRLHVSQWEDRTTKEKKSRMEVIADRIELHGPKPEARPRDEIDEGFIF